MRRIPAVTSRRGAWAGYVSAAAALGFGCIAFLLLLRYGSPPAGDELDLSWAAVLGWAHDQGSFWGTELVFTFGPMGFITPFASYIPSTFATFWAAQLALTGASAVVLATASTALGVSARIILLALIVTSFIWLPGDGTWFIAMPALFLVLERHMSSASASTTTIATLLIAGSAYAAVVALIKFSLFPLFVMLWLATSILVFVRARRLTLLAATIFPAWLLLFWTVAGQPPENLPTFIERAIAVSGGYGVAMGLWPGTAIDAASIAATFATAATIVTLMWSGRRDAGKLLGAVLLLAVLAIVWRATIVRMVLPRLAVLLPVCCALALMVSSYAADWRRLRIASILLAGGLLLAGIVASPVSLSETVVSTAPGLIRTNLAAIRVPSDVTRNFDGQWRDKATLHDLPLTRAEVGTQTIDLIPYQQGLVLLNGFNYSPRPVFQSYAAYTAGLARLNEAHFLGEAAPSYVLLSIGTIDGRIASGDDGLALLVLVARYRPVLRERDYILLKLDAGSPSAPVSLPSANRYEQVDLGQVIAVPGSLQGQGQLAFVDAGFNVFGRVVSSLLRAPALYIETQTGTDDWRRHRLIPAQASAGFLVDPPVDSTDAAAALFVGALVPTSPIRIRIVGETDWRRLTYRGTVAIAFAPIDLPERIDEPRAAEPGDAIGVIDPDPSVPPLPVPVDRE